MRILVQRVLNAKLEIGGEKICQIEKGIVAYVGFKEGDFEGHLPSAANKLLTALGQAFPRRFRRKRQNHYLKSLLKF